LVLRLACAKLLHWTKLFANCAVMIQEAENKLSNYQPILGIDLHRHNLVHCLFIIVIYGFQMFQEPNSNSHLLLAM